ncbi:MAG TPA: hypothetical protein VGS57_08780 [Thermoanaerobaculia bacterium]|jgi:hypothetical protein|nr:hypothetical protein [Thermoanaerobaculia bacterium]
MSLRLFGGMTLLLTALSICPLRAEHGMVDNSCSWGDSAAELLLDRELPAFKLDGPIEGVLVPFLRGQGVPVSFIAAQAGTGSIHWSGEQAASLRALLEATLRQSPEFGYRIIAGKVVIYPPAEGYDASLTLGNSSVAPRGKAMYSILRDIKTKVPFLADLGMPTLRSMGDRHLYGDLVVTGGRRSIVEHLAAITGSAPDIAFGMVKRADGHLAFGLELVRVLAGIKASGPAVMEVGATARVEVVGRLMDGKSVALSGPACGLDFLSSDVAVLEVDGSGLVRALEPGEVTVSVRHGSQSDQIHVRVK